MSMFDAGSFSLLQLIGLILGLIGLGAVMARLATGWVLKQLLAQRIFDQPNERSSHIQPTPRGGGWGILIVVIPIWTLVLSGTVFGLSTLYLLLGAVLLAGISWLDDIRTIAARHRLAVHIIAVLLGLMALDGLGPVGPAWLPLWLDRLIVGLAWLWFLNLYNFMDGIDGLAGSETACIGAGVIAVILTSPVLLHGWPAGALLGAVLVGGSIGFLCLNWHPARVFMGDVGSIPLGFLIGWLLFALAAQDHLIAAIILPLYFCADASITLLKRLSKGARPWQAHREHFYQQSVQAGRSHGRTTTLIIACNLLLILCAIASNYIGWPAIIPAVIVTGILLVWLARPSDGPVQTF
jgi:UDP-N-acetylmuramyl pentapeptide phosphotransferase/UDP-N-acetylglucosamine-1-phosphate transferase